MQIKSVESTNSVGIIYPREGPVKPKQPKIQFVDLSIGDDGFPSANGAKCLSLANGTLQLLPTKAPAQTNCLYVAGPSGAGKTTYVSSWLVEYRARHPDRAVYFFSRKPEDQQIDMLIEEYAKAEDVAEFSRVLLDESFLAFTLDDLMLEQFRNSCCVFDDIDTLSDRKILDKVRKLRDDLIQTGRSYGISVISTSHTICNHKETKQILAECNQITLFPRAGNRQGITDYLKRYQGFGRDEIKQVFDMQSRWVTLNTRAPRWIAGEHKIQLLD